MRLATRLALYEGGSLDDDDAALLFQDLVDTGAICHLQGHYQRTASDMIDAGIILPPGSPQLDGPDRNALESDWAKSGIHAWRSV